MEKKSALCASQKQGHTLWHRTPACGGFQEEKEMDEPKGVIFFPRKCASSRVFVAVTRKKTEHSTEGPREAYAVSPHGRQLAFMNCKDAPYANYVICFCEIQPRGKPRPERGFFGKAARLLFEWAKMLRFKAKAFYRRGTNKGRHVLFINDSRWTRIAIRLNGATQQLCSKLKLKRNQVA